MHPRRIAFALLTIGLPLAASAQDPDRSVAGGGISVPGWKGKIDARPMKEGKTINDSRFALKDGKLQLAIGPAATYWNESLTAKGNYEVKASFTENKHNPRHPHSYGVFIGGADLAGNAQTYAYCIVYANGKYSAKYFHGDSVKTLVNMAEHAAIKKAVDGVATNEVGWRVAGDKASCVINGTEVASWTKADLVGAMKLKSFDGMYGIRVSHNVDVTATPPTLVK